MLLGRNPVANEAAALMKEMLADVPPQHRATIARSAAISPRSRGRICKTRGHRSAAGAQDLTSMGLTYHDSKQFLDAVKRNDAIAAELFIAGRGVDLSARDFWGRDASISRAPTATSASPS